MSELRAAEKLGNFGGRDDVGGGAVGFPIPLPDSDRSRWDGLTTTQRDRARRRLEAILAWRAGAIPFAEAIRGAGLSRTRFYAVAAAFKEAGDLESLGAFAGTGAARPRLDPDAVNALQAVVAAVVARNDGASVNRLVQLMVAASGVTANLPGSSRLRGIVEAEIRRAAATGEAGFALEMDFTAVNLPRGDGRPHVMFVLIDAGTRLVLGHWVGGTTDEDVGYREAALDALARVEREFASLRWTDRMMRIDATVGTDRARAVSFRARLLGNRAHPPVNLAPARYGRYFRRFVGERVGRVAITPARTESGMAVPDNGDMTPWSDEEARAAVALALGGHNAGILAASDGGAGRPVMPDDLANALSILSR